MLLARLRLRARSTVPGTMLVLSTALAWLSPRTGAQPKSSTTLTGIVTDAFSGRPIAGASVFVEGGQTGLLATTDETGGFAGVVADDVKCTVRAVKVGYFDGTVTSDAFTPTAVREDRPNARMVRLRLWRYASVSGTVSDAQGRPVEQAVVSIWPRLFVAGAVQIAKGTNVRTDDRGRYFLSRLQQGEYLVGMQPRRVTGKDVAALVFFPGVVTADQSQSLVLGPGEERTDIDFKLAPSQGRTVQGVVKAGFPLSGTLQVSLVPDDLSSNGAGGAIAQVAVDTRGGFSFAGVPSGAYWLIVDSETFQLGYGGDGSFPVSLGFSGIGYRTYFKRPSPSTRISGRVSIVVDRGDLHDVVIPLKAGTNVGGQIIVDDPVAKLPPFKIVAEPADGDLFRGMALATVESSGGAGTFVVSGLNEGAFFLRLLTTGRLAIRSVAIRNRETNDDPITIRADDNVEDVRLTLTVKPPLLTGSIRSQAREPLYVVAFPANPKMWQQYGFNPPFMRTVALSTAGTFQLDGLPAGDYFVAAVGAYRRNDWRDPELLRKLAPQSKRVTLTWGGSQSIVLDPR